MPPIFSARTFFPSGSTSSSSVVPPERCHARCGVCISSIRPADQSAAATCPCWCDTAWNGTPSAAAIVSAISKNVDGIILCPVQKTRDNIGFIAKNRIPYVLLGRRFEGNPSSYVICDDLNGGYAAAEHLIGLGHKKLLFINAPLYISSARDRFEGVKRAMAQGGLPPEALHCAKTVPAPDEKEVMACLKKYKDCTGIICFSDMLAMQVCCFLQKLGKKVPDDVSVIGFDDIASKFYLPLMLTSVTSSKTKMSMEAVDILMHVIQNKTEKTTQIVLPTHVVQRESTKER